MRADSARLAGSSGPEIHKVYWCVEAVQPRQVGSQALVQNPKVPGDVGASCFPACPAYTVNGLENPTSHILPCFPCSLLVSHQPSLVDTSLDGTVAPYPVELQ